MNSLKALVYFSIFKYPLSAREVFLFSGATTQNEIDNELTYLKNKGIVSQINDFYTLDHSKSTVDRRLSGNQMAERVMEKAIKKGLFISKFPYVEAVGISGSLSKNYHDKDSDVDFFVITKSGRLWVSRTLLMLYKKLFLLNSRKFFCINYYVSRDTLEITEKNIFTATELLTLIPVAGDFVDFYNKNQWVSNFLPNLTVGKKSLHTHIERNQLSKLVTRILDTKLGVYSDRFFLKLTLKKWKIKFNDLNKEDFEVALKSTSGVSKHHPRNFQRKVIDRLNQKYREIQSQYDIELEKEYA